MPRHVKKNHGLGVSAGGSERISNDDTMDSEHEEQGKEDDDDDEDEDEDETTTMTTMRT
jgi:hypothetical protein